MATARKRLVLHIGFHRAGSATVHESLHASRVALRDHRVVYPQPLTPHPSHLDLATALGFNPRDELRQLDRVSVLERYRRLIDDCQPGSIIVLASEEFCLGNFLPQAMEHLRVFLDKLDVEVTVSAATRDPLAFLIDVYRTELRDTDAGADFSQWLDGFDLAGADFDGRLTPWRALLGPAEELRVRDVDAAAGGDVPGEPAADDHSTWACGRRALDAVLADCELAPDAIPLIQPPGVDLHPQLIEPLLAVRRRIPELADRRRLLEALLEISPLLEPVTGPVAEHLGAGAVAAFEARSTAAGADTSADAAAQSEPTTPSNPEKG